MALPTSTTWDVANFDEATLGGLLSLGAGDLVISPSTAPYFYYQNDVLHLRSENGVAASLTFDVSISSQFTLDMVVLFRRLPRNTGDLSTRRLGVTVADDATRGASVNFAMTGMAVSRVDDYGSVSALPDTSQITELSGGLWTIRIAFSAPDGRAMVFASPGVTEHPALLKIVPIEATPPPSVDVFRWVVQGTSEEPAHMEIHRLRLADTLVVSNLPPIANAGPDRRSTVGSAVRFDGRTSFDVEGAELTYRWRLIDAPYGSQFRASIDGGLTDDDGNADGLTDTYDFPPLVLPDWVSPGDLLKVGVELYEIVSIDNAGGFLTISSNSLPDDLAPGAFQILRQSGLVDRETEAPYLVPDVQGVYRVDLTVYDGVQGSFPSEAIASISGARTPFGVEPDVTDFWNMLGDEWSVIEGRQIFQEAWTAAAQIVSGKLFELWQYHYNYSIQDAQRTLQKKWVPFRTLMAEPDPVVPEVHLRYGPVVAEHRFDASNPPVTGETLTVAVWIGVQDLLEVPVIFTGDDIDTVLSDLNTALSPHGVFAYSFGRRKPGGFMDRADGATTDDGDGNGVTSLLTFTPGIMQPWVSVGDTINIASTRVVIQSIDDFAGEATVSPEIPDNLSGESFRVYRRVQIAITGAPFQILPSSGATLLGLETGSNRIRGQDGTLVTDRSYYLGDGITLPGLVTRGDLLVVNNGQQITIARVTTDPLDPLPNQRVLTTSVIPDDVTPEWEIPSLISGSLDYYSEGAYPGDIVLGTLVSEDSSLFVDLRGPVTSVSEDYLAADLTAWYGTPTDPSWTIWTVGLRRRKAIPIGPDVISIPRLQDMIPVAVDKEIYLEQVDYTLEPFYRDLDSAPLPMLQWRDATFITPDEDPPNILWAEVVYYDNERNIENLFGRLTGFLRDDASAFDRDFNYTSAVAGLLYSRQRGHRVEAMRIGTQILLGQPFAEVRGVVQSVDFDFAPTTGRLLVRDDDGKDPIETEVVRSYIYGKDPRDNTATTGLADNPETGVPWAVGDKIPQFAPIGAGVRIVDIYNEPLWFRSFVRSGLLHEVEKFHKFLVEFDLDAASLVNITLLYQFVLRVKPSHTHPILLGMRRHEDDIDVQDNVAIDLAMELKESLGTDGPSYTYSDFRGDGTHWLYYGGGAVYGQMEAAVMDELELRLVIDWAGGIPTADDIFFLYGVDVEDIDGVFAGPPGTLFTPIPGDSIPAGPYGVYFTT